MSRCGKDIVKEDIEMANEIEKFVDANGNEYEVAEESLTAEQMTAVRAKVLENHNPQGVVWDENPRFARLLKEQAVSEK